MHLDVIRVRVKTVNSELLETLINPLAIQNITINAAKDEVYVWYDGHTYTLVTVEEFETKIQPYLQNFVMLAE